MNNLFSKIFRGSWLPAALVIFLGVGALAQDGLPEPNRYLFIFSTSSVMKSRRAATEKEVNTLLSTAMDGKLRREDTIGVWMFDGSPRAGKFPLVHWQPEDAAAIAKAINRFIHKQHYSGTNNFRALQPLLNEVVKNSQRLTVLIFCDGSDDFTGTPYDGDINQIFHQRWDELKKSKRPFIVALRAQQGKFIGGSVNFPPGMVSLPPFPPLPEPAPEPEPVPEPVTNAPPPKPQLPLVIIGTRIETNWAAYHFAMTNVPAPKTNPPKIQPATNSPAPVETPQTNAVIAPETNAIETISNHVAVATNSATVTNTVASTNPAALSKKSEPERRNAIALAAGFLVAAIVLAVWFIFGSRRKDHGSLISRSMKK